MVRFCNFFIFLSRVNDKTSLLSRCSKTILYRRRLINIIQNAGFLRYFQLLPLWLCSYVLWGFLSERFFFFFFRGAALLCHYYRHVTRYQPYTSNRIKYGQYGLTWRRNNKSLNIERPWRARVTLKRRGKLQKKKKSRRGVV